MKTTNPWPDNCTVVDITKEDDFTSELGYNKVFELCQASKRVAMLVSFPCTGGCLWNVGINSKNPKCRARLKAHLRLFHRL